MNRNGGNDSRGDPNREEDDNQNSSWWAGAAVAGVAALAGAVYLSWTKEPPKTPAKKPEQKLPVKRAESEGQRSGAVSGLINLLSVISSPSSEAFYLSGKVGRNPPPTNPIITNLNALLADIHVRFIQLKNDDFQLHYKVFDRIFQHMHQKMKEVDRYYGKYSSTVQFAGSHYDNLRIKKPDEFDVDIVIGLPLNLSEHRTNRNESDIVIEPQAAGYVQLRMGTQFQNLPMRDGEEWQNNKAAYRWMDNANYLSRSKFLDWFKSVANLALNTFQRRGNRPIFYIDGVEYVIDKSESGPAFTLLIKNQRSGFQLDVDLVPALKFPESRWPIGSYYRQIPLGCCKNTWMVVGKPDKSAPAYVQERGHPRSCTSWRIALHNQERELMHNSHNLRQALRLLKKLRDEQGMKKIASYYIKTIFFWEIVERNDRTFWSKNNPAYLFKHMVQILHSALVKGTIPYFWHSKNNLIWNVDKKTLQYYAAKLVPLMEVLKDPSGDKYKLVAKYLLSPKEYKNYNEKILQKSRI